MWNSCSPVQKTIKGVVFSAFCFSTHVANSDAESFIDQWISSGPRSNLSEKHWVSINLDNMADSSLSTEVTGVADIITRVKMTLGLPNKDIADIFRVTRQTLHSYAKNTDVEHAINKSTLERALLVNEIIKEISAKFGKSPGAMAKNYTIDGFSLLDLMSAPEIDIKQVISFSSKLSIEMARRTQSKTPLDNDNALYELTRSS